MNISPPTRANRDLFRAVEKNDLALLQQALDAGADIVKGRRDSDTCLFRACKAGHYDIVRQLVQHGAPLQYQSGTRNIFPDILNYRADPEILSAIFDCPNTPKDIAKMLVGGGENETWGYLVDGYRTKRISIFKPQFREVVEACLILVRQHWTAEAQEEFWLLAARSHVEDEQMLDLLTHYLGDFPFGKAPAIQLRECSMALLKHGVKRGAFKPEHCFTVHPDDDKTFIETFIQGRSATIEYHKWLFDFLISDHQTQHQLKSYLPQWAEHIVSNEASKNMVLHMSKKSGMSIPQLLLEVNSPNPLLHLCLDKGYSLKNYSSCIALLVQHGADIYTPSPQGLSAIEKLGRYKGINDMLLEEFFKAGANFRDPDGDRAALTYSSRQHLSPQIFDEALAKWDAMDGQRQLQETTQMPQQPSRRMRL